MNNEEWINMFINKFNESKDYKITDIRDREKLLDELRPTGEWIYLFTFLDSKVYECNHCKGRLSLDIPQRIEDFKYCNGCGAKMKEANNV